MAETTFFKDGSKVNVTIIDDYVEGDKKTGVLNFEGHYKGFQVLGGKTFLGFERVIAEGKKTKTEEFTVNADKVFYLQVLPDEKKEEKEDEAPAKGGKGKGSANDDD